jgi:hypothetical protein
VLLTAAAGQARFDHNPNTGESLGLLVEEQRSNLLTYSEQFNDVSWIKNDSTITANIIVAPDGTLTGEKLVENTANAQHIARKNVSGLSSGATVTISVYAKAAERTSVFLYINETTTSTNRVEAIYNLLTGVVTNTGNFGTFTGASANITLVGNGWYRLSLTGVITNLTSAQFRIGTYDGSAFAYTGDGYSGLYIWGAQLEAGAFATSYIPTVASTITRNADIAIMTGTNFSSWYNASEGTLYLEGEYVAVENFKAGFNFNNTTTSEFISIQTSTAPASRLNVTVGGVSQATLSTGNLTANLLFKLSGVIFCFFACREP